MQVVLEDQIDVDPCDEATIHGHLHKVVNNLIEKSREGAPIGSEPMLPLVRIKVDYTGCSMINSKQFGQHYVGKIANPQDILLLTRSRQRHQTIQESCNISEELSPNELNQETVEALIVDSDLKLQILSVDDLNSALNDFVKEDDNTAFQACVQQNIEEVINKLTTTKDYSVDQEKLQEKESQSKERTSSQNLQADTLSVSEKQKCSTTTEEQQQTLDSDDEPIEFSDPEESGSPQAGKKRRALPGGGGSAAAGGRRKTDLASFQRIPAKEDDVDTAKKPRAPVAAGRYGAVIRRN